MKFLQKADFLLIASFGVILLSACNNGGAHDKRDLTAIEGGISQSQQPDTNQTQTAQQSPEAQMQSLLEEVKLLSEESTATASSDVDALTSGELEGLIANLAESIARIEALEASNPDMFSGGDEQAEELLALKEVLVSQKQQLEQLASTSSNTSSSQNQNSGSTSQTDTTLPILAISSPTNGGFCSASDCNSFSITGTCDEEDGLVTLSGTVTGSAICSSGSWNAILDFSGVAEDTVITVNANISDAAGNAAIQKSVSLTKDTTAPTVNVGSDLNISATTAVNATSSDSHDLTYQWSKQSGTGTITFSMDTAEDTDISSDTPGTFVIRLTVTDAAGNEAYDELSLVWTNQPIYETNFDDASDWNTSSIWECGVTAGTVGPSAAHSGTSVCATYINANYATDSLNAILGSPDIDLTGATQPILGFWMYMNAEDDGQNHGWDGGYIQISIDEDSLGSWGPYRNLSKDDLGVQGFGFNKTIIDPGSNPGWSGSMPTSEEWREVKLDLFNLESANLNAIDNNDSIRIRFVFRSDVGGSNYPGWYIDDFYVQDKAPVNLKSFPYSQNFDAEDDWFALGTHGLWEIGDQTNGTYGPSSGHSGNTVAGTILNADHNSHDAYSLLSSPVIDLTGSTTPKLNFWMTMEAETSGCGTACDGGAIFIRVNGGDWKRVTNTDTGYVTTGGQITPSYNPISGGLGNQQGWSGTISTWSQVTIDLLNMSSTGLTTITSTDSIEVAFAFVSDNGNGSHAGWYIDDVSVTD